MAITRAQQAKQMLRDGGRLGYRFGSRGYQGRDAKTGKGGASRGPSKSSSPKSTGPSFNDVSRASDDDRRQTYSAVQTQTGKVKGGGKGIGTDKRGNVVFEDRKITGDEGRAARDDFIRGVIGNQPPKQKKSFLESIFGDRRRQAYNIARSLPGAAKSSYNNLIAYRDYLKSQGADLTTIDRLLGGVDEETPIGFDAFEELAYNYEPKGIEDIETLRDIFTDTTRGPFEKLTAVPQNFSEFMLTQRNNPNLFAKGDLGNFMNMTKPKDLVNPNTGELYTNAEFEELKREIGQDRGLLGGGEDPSEPSDPCLGPNPPAYCATRNQDPGDGNTNRERGLALRFMNRGGMPMDAPTTGGIMDLETGRQMYFLGKLVKKATRAVKKIVKSPIGKAALFAAPFAFSPAARGAVGSFFGKGSFNPLKALITTGPQAGKIGGSGLGNLLAKFGLAKEGALTTKGMFGLGGGLLALLPFLSDEEKQQVMDRGEGLDIGYIRDNPYTFKSIVGSGGGIAPRFADGGSTEKEPVAKRTMPLLDMGGKEMDLREDGGFVPIGRMEKADDVPARLSKNEFVFTADAVRNAGDGDVDKGAEVMYNMMKNLESGGDVSEESQGLEGARRMFQTSKRLEEVL